MTLKLSPLRLFRKAQNSLEQRVGSGHQQMAVKQSPRMVKLVVWVLMGTTAFGVGWLAFAKTEEVVTAPGKLQPIGDVKTVQMPQGGVLKEMLVKEGQRVSKGDVLLRLDNEASVDRESGLDNAIAAKRKELTLKQTEFDRYLEINQTERQVAVSTLDLDREVLMRLELLRRAGGVAELQYLQQRTKVKQDEGDVTKAKIDRLRQSAILRQQIQSLKGELADLSTRLTESRVANRYQAIRSPVDGVVFDLKPTGPGFVGQGSEPVMKIVPFDALQAKVEVPSSKIGFVRLGQSVDVSIDSFPASDFGVLQGEIKRIGSDALAPDQMNQDYRYPVNVGLKSQTLRLSSGQRLPLQVGMSLTANIKLRKVTYLQLLLSDFKDKTDSLKKI
jgi:HlyD family secretion protein